MKINFSTTVMDWAREVSKATDCQVDAVSCMYADNTLEVACYTMKDLDTPFHTETIPLELTDTEKNFLYKEFTSETLLCQPTSLDDADCRVYYIQELREAKEDFIVDEYTTIIEWVTRKQEVLGMQFQSIVLKYTEHSVTIAAYLDKLCHNQVLKETVDMEIKARTVLSSGAPTPLTPGIMLGFPSSDEPVFIYNLHEAEKLNTPVLTKTWLDYLGGFKACGDTFLPVGVGNSLSAITSRAGNTGKSIVASFAGKSFSDATAFDNGRWFKMDDGTMDNRAAISLPESIENLAYLTRIKGLSTSNIEDSWTKLRNEFFQMNVDSPDSLHTIAIKRTLGPELFGMTGIMTGCRLPTRFGFMTDFSLIAELERNSDTLKAGGRFFKFTVDRCRRTTVAPMSGLDSFRLFIPDNSNTIRHLRMFDGMITWLNFALGQLVYETEDHELCLDLCTGKRAINSIQEEDHFEIWLRSLLSVGFIGAMIDDHEAFISFAFKHKGDWTSEPEVVTDKDPLVELIEKYVRYQGIDNVRKVFTGH